MAYVFKVLSCGMHQNARSHRTPGNVNKVSGTPGEMDWDLPRCLFSPGKQPTQLSTKQISLPEANLTDFETSAHREISVWFSYEKTNGHGSESQY